MTLPEAAILDEATRISGVRCALLVTADDGLIVAESALEGLDTRAAAALASSLARRLAGLTRTLGHGEASLLMLEAAGGRVFIAFGGEGLLVVAVTDHDVNIGQVRLALLDAAGRLL
jgi:predicted regulator of Ras-like GTPase activity (Roadblock/LC7/MglB family)